MSVLHSISHLPQSLNSINIEVSHTISDLLCAFKATARYICYHLRTDMWNPSQQCIKAKKVPCCDILNIVH